MMPNQSQKIDPKLIQSMNLLASSKNPVQNNYLAKSNWSIENEKDSEMYGSVVNRMAEAVGESESLMEYLKKAISIFYHTTIATVIIILLILYHLVQTIIGIKHLDDCPKEPKIPIYLFVGGCVGLLKSLHLAWNQMRKKDQFSVRINGQTLNHDGIDNELIDNEEASIGKGSAFTDALLSIFLAIWFAFGNYWILSVYQPHLDNYLLNPTNWCYKRLYLFAIIHLCVYYSLIILSLVSIFLLTVFTQIPYLIRKFQDC